MLKKLMEMRRKKGVTLIELIVVLVIMAILAAVAIPQMMKYVNNAKRAQHLAECTAVYTALQSGITQSKIRDTAAVVAAADEADWGGTNALALAVDNEGKMTLGKFVVSFVGDDVTSFKKGQVTAEDTASDIVPTKDNVNHWIITFDHNDATVSRVTRVAYIFGSGTNDYVIMTPGQSTNTMEGA